MVGFSKQIFLTTLLISILVFGAGLLLGWNLDKYRSQDVSDDLRTNELDTESFLIEQNFLDSFAGGDDCSFAEPRLAQISSELIQLGQTLESYEQKNIFQDAEFKYLARRYFLLEIKGYTQFNELKDKCHIKNDVILYFYDPEDSQSALQGYVLDRVANEANGSVDVFSINQNFAGDSAISTVKIYYNITTSPTIIVNGKEKREGYTSYEEVKVLLASDL
ncbi:hypothetical protein HZA98_01730 [Candidatus Woesearchaeota archaeon]|nr:hypothetical protein [Candidatus Woesearchaeota archaeon]